METNRDRFLRVFGAEPEEIYQMLKYEFRKWCELPYSATPKRDEYGCIVVKEETDERN